MKERIIKKANEIIIHYYRIYVTGIAEHKFNKAKNEAIYLINNILDAIPSNANDIEDFLNLRDYIYDLKFSSEDWERI